MRWSQSFIPTMKEIPADAEIPSHQLMLRAGLIRQLMAGAYTYLPLGKRALRKAEAIVREEMDKAGAVEMTMPVLHPVELWERTGRVDAFGSVLIHLQVKRGDREVPLVLGPTHEEVITDLMAHHISSYRQLPLTLYQIQLKFRNEERPRFGVLRTSEFLMKDAYSFGATLEQLDESYQKMYNAYCRIFARCGLKYLPVEAESGPIGGDASHEFMIPADNGEDRIVHCSHCNYAANLERADTGRTSYIPSDLPQNAPALEEVHTPDVTSIEQVGTFLKRPANQFIKTLIYLADEEPVAVLIRGDHEANEAKIRRALKAETIALADDNTIRTVTGAPVGFAGPIGLECKRLADHDIASMSHAVSGANKGDHHYTGVTIGRDFPLKETFDLRMAAASDPCPKCGTPLELVHGIEVGHVFKLGTKYSEALGASFLDEHEQRHPLIMGCYGIGVNRILAGLAETSYDEDGLIWPLSIAPFEVELISLAGKKDPETKIAADKLYQQFREAGVDVLYDDRELRPGVKFKDADLIGIPLRVVVGSKGLQAGEIEVKWRTADEAEKIPVAEILIAVQQLLKVRREQDMVV